MTSGDGGTIWSVRTPDTVPNDPSGVSHLARRVVMAVVALTMVMAAFTGPVATASAQGSGDPPGTVAPEPTVPPDTTTTLPPDTTTTVPPETTTTFVPPTTVAPAPTSTFAPGPSTTFAPAPSTSTSTPTPTSTSTTEPTDSSVVADDRTVLEPAPGVFGPAQDGGGTVDVDDGPGWWTAGTRLRLAVAGLGSLAMVVSVLTLLYWRHTKPDLTMGARDEPSGDHD